MDNIEDPWNFHRCKLCSYRTRYTPRILSHVRQHRTRLKNHQFICHLHTPGNYQCEECRFQSDYKVLITSHFNTIHKITEAKPYPNPVLKYCENCDFETFSTLVLLRHLIRCDGSRNLIFQKSQTENCQLEKEKKQSNLQKRRPTKPKKIIWFQCNHCSYKTTRNYNFKKHVLYRHTPLEEISWFKCEHCAYKSKYNYNLTRHNQLRHAQASEQIMWFKCGHCSFKTKNKNSFSRHICTQYLQASEVEKLKRFECDHCSYITTRNSSLKSHVLYKHTPSEQINWLKCEQCSYKAKNKNPLIRHIRIQHASNVITALLKIQPAQI